MAGVSMPSSNGYFAPLTTALPSWATVTRGAGSWSRQTAAAVDGTTFITTGTDQNTGRFSYLSASARRMFLIEPTRTNLLTDSNFVDAGANDIPDNWNHNNGVTGADYETVVTGAPHNGAYFTLLDEDAANYVGVNQAIAGAALTQYTYSAWMLGTNWPAGEKILTFAKDPGLAMLTPTTGTWDWTKLSATDTTVGNVGIVGYMCANTAVPSAGTLRISLPQIEAGAYATSWVPTSAGAGARAAELCAIDAACVGRTSGCVSFLWAPMYASTVTLGAAAGLFEWAPGWRIDYDSADQKIKVVVNNVNRAETAALTFAAGELFKLTVRYGSAGQQITVHQAAGTPATTSNTTAWGDPGALAPYLGSLAASANCESAHYADLLLAA